MSKIKKSKEERQLSLIRSIRIFMLVILCLCIVLGFLAKQQEISSYFFVSGFTCIVTLVLTFVPSFVNKKLNIVVPLGIQTIIVIFILLAEFFGEILHFYDVFWWWDVMLHTSSGVILGILGVLVVYSLNIKDDIFQKMNPKTIMMFAFCFAIAAGAVWELFEFSGDYFLGMNMQRSVYTHNELGTTGFNEEAINYFNENVRFFDGLKEGETGRVFDPGLMDTMEDFIVDTIGAIIAVILFTMQMKKGYRRSS